MCLYVEFNNTSQWELCSPFLMNNLLTGWFCYFYGTSWHLHVIMIFEGLGRNSLLTWAQTSPSSRPVLCSIPDTVRQMRWAGTQPRQGPPLLVNKSTLDTPVSIAGHTAACKVAWPSFCQAVQRVSSEAGCGREDMLIPTLTSKVSTFSRASC